MIAITAIITDGLVVLVIMLRVPKGGGHWLEISSQRVGPGVKLLCFNGVSMTTLFAVGALLILSCLDIGTVGNVYVNYGA